MRLANFKLYNFRSIQRLELNFEDSHIITFIGSISTGKSNVLRSLELFWNQAIINQEIQTLDEKLFFSKFQDRSQNTKIEAQWQFLSVNSTVESVQFEGTKIKDFLNDYTPKYVILKFQFDPAIDKKPSRWVGFIPKDLSDPSENQQLIKVNGDGINWLINDPYSDYISDFHQELGSKLIFRFRAEWDIDVELYLKKLQEKPVEKANLENLISRVFGESTKIEYIDRPNQHINGFSNKAVVLRKENKSILPYSFLSHSSKRLIAVLSVLANSNNNYPEHTKNVVNGNFTLPKILLIDSPEIGDPRSQRALADILIEHADPHQIVLSSQSPRFMLGSAFLVQLHNSSTVVSAVTSQKDLEKIVNILGIKPSDSLSSDAVVFVEGVTDAAVFKIFLDKIGAKENISTRPLVSFVPVDGWTKMSFTISVRILKSKFVRTNAYAIVDGDTVRQTKSFNKIQSSFESVFGHKSFLRLKESCLESIFLNHPNCIAKALNIKKKDVIDTISILSKQHMKDKDILKEIITKFHPSNENGEHLNYTSIMATKIAMLFSIDDIPDRIRRLLRKVLWDNKH